MKEKEISYEYKVRVLITEKIIPEVPEINILDSKVLSDIIICRNCENPKLFFFEIKHFNYSNNRIGFGSKGKVTFQPEILSKRPKFFEKNMRWVFFMENDPSFYVLSNEDCCKYISGESINLNKQNNFKYTSLFRETVPYSESEFIQWLIRWLKS